MIGHAAALILIDSDSHPVTSPKELTSTSDSTTGSDSAHPDSSTASATPRSHKSRVPHSYAPHKPPPAPSARSRLHEEPKSSPPWWVASRFASALPPWTLRWGGTARCPPHPYTPPDHTCRTPSPPPPRPISAPS